jgi:DNA-binding transcriptional ArsR family regulator
MGDPTRLALIARLNDGQPHSISQLSDGLGLTRQGVTKHLAVLAQAGLVTSHAVGRETRFALMPEPVAEARAYLDRISAAWGDALGRLEKFLAQ